MTTRRTFLYTAVAGLPAFAGVPSISELFARDRDRPALSMPGVDDVTQFVKLQIGTGGHGHTYPGATVPFGMVQLSPDTYNEGWDWCSGYHYSDSSIMGFSHTHLSGTGASDMLDFLLMPGIGVVKLVPGTRENPDSGYRSRFAHEDEFMTPGYYSVLLKDYGIKAELTATERAGIHRYTFPQSDSSHFILDLTHVFGNDVKDITSAELAVIGNDTIIGGRRNNGWAPGRQLFFAMKFSKPFESFDIYANDQKLSNANSSNERLLKVVLHYRTAKNEIIQVETGISGVDKVGARLNMEAEVGSLNFDEVRQSAQKKWQAQLGKIAIKSSNRKHLEIFYTSLYHMFVAPTLFDDSDGRYRGMDGKVHQLPAHAHNFSTFSLWDTYRAAHPMYTLVQPEMVPTMVNCLIRMASESPAGMPVWPLQAKETGTMTGYHSASVIAEAYKKGFQGIDWIAAYPLMRKRAMDDDYRGLGYYRRLGYIPADKEEESASKQMEYVYDDWAVSQIAGAIGATADQQLLLQRSMNYRNLFDKKMNFVRPRLENGGWAEPFDPRGMGHSKKWRDFTEANSWETTFAVQHDVKGYMELFGGREAFIAKLDELFTTSSELPPDAPPDIAGLVGQYAHGNEPCHHIAYLYSYAGVPYKTHERVRSLLETMYDNQPDGLAGNEDCGQMSAWYVISALGFYAVDPASGTYVLGAPFFDYAEIELPNGRKLVMRTQRNSPSDIYVQSVTFAGQPHPQVWFSHEDIKNGGEFVFTMGSKPNLQYGAGESDAPPSLTK